MREQCLLCEWGGIDNLHIYNIHGNNGIEKKTSDSVEVVSLFGFFMFLCMRECVFPFSYL